MALRLGTLNKVLINGYLTKDPELRHTAGGTAVLNFGIASNRRYKDASGEWQDDATFINVVAWKETAERMAERLQKGSAAFVEGRLQSRSWETKEGQKRSTIEICAITVQALDKYEEQDAGTAENAPPPSDDDIPL